MPLLCSARSGTGHIYYSLTGTSASQTFPIRNGFLSKLLVVVKSLDNQLAQFLRKKRGNMSFAQFSRLTGLTPSTLFRLENEEQSITLRRLEPVLKKLKCSVGDVLKT
jgi:DNA-binding Xre family transcriptional regulator